VKSHDACLLKAAYATEAEAQVKGQEVYFCLYCEKYHRRTPMAQKMGPLKWRHTERLISCSEKRRRETAL
jgi:hypothetical protein